MAVDHLPAHRRSARPPGRRQVLGGAAALAGFAASRPARAATELRYLNVESDPASVAFLKQLAIDYEAATGVKMTVETIVGTTLWTKVTTAIKTGRPYDIIDFAQPTQTVLLAQQNELVPVTDIINEIGLADFGAVSMVKYKDDLWYFPLMYNFCCHFYRRDWLADAGLGIPKTWNEFATVAKTFTDASKRRFGTSFPYSAGLTPWGNSGFLWAGGMKIYDDKFNVLIDSPEIKPKLARALEMLAAINPYNVPGQFNMTLLNIRTNFISGSAGIVAASGALIQDIDTKAPELADKFVIAPYPAPDGGKGTVVYGGKGLGIGKSGNSRAALDFLRWFVKTGKLVDFQLSLPMYMQPVQVSTYQNPKWLNDPTVKKYWPTMQTLRSFMDPNVVNVDALQLQGSHITANQGKILNAELILAMYQNVLTKKMTVSEAIDDCAAQIRKLTEADA